MTALQEDRAPQGVLQVDKVSKHFGGLAAVDQVSLHVPAGQITSLIGPNGAGKTTLFNCLTGVLTPTSGRVLLDGRDITRLPMHQRAQRGLGRTFQRLEVFAGMTVENNLLVAAESVERHRGHHGRPSAREVTAQVLETVGLTGLRHSTAGELSTGTLRLVELGRALCVQPRVLLLDEPGSGLDSRESEVLREILTAIAGSGVGVLLVEHDVELVMALSQTIYVVDFGRLIAVGTPTDISESDEVRRAYLGVGV